jgi:hypothetical protein
LPQRKPDNANCFVSGAVAARRICLDLDGLGITPYRWRTSLKPAEYTQRA